MITRWALILVTWSGVAFADKSPWEGAFTTGHEEIAGGEWGGDLDVSGCDDKGCQFQIHSIFRQNLCDVSGRFAFEGPNRAVFEEETGRVGIVCRITFVWEAKADKISVSSKNCDGNCGLNASFDDDYKRAAVKASFDCRKASTAVEKAICANASLAKLDQKLALLYKDARDEVPAGSRTVLLESQREWTKRNERQCTGEKLETCLAERYEARSQLLVDVASACADKKDRKECDLKKLLGGETKAP